MLIIRHGLLALLLSLLGAQAQPPTVEFTCPGYSNWVCALAFPTTADRLRFVGPLDGMYSNACEARGGREGTVVIDETNRVAELRFTPVTEPPPCPRIWSPVHSAEVQFGPVGAGVWEFRSTDYRFTNVFEVLPAAPPPRLSVEPESGAIRLRWTGMPNRIEALETSATLAQWLPAASIVIEHDGTNRALLWPAGHEARFFRLRHSPVPNPLPEFPTDCGQ